MLVPVIAPVWADLNFTSEGLLYSRSSQDAGILDRVGGMISDVNPALSDYKPTLAVVVTWFEAKIVSSITYCLEEKIVL